MGPDSAAPPHSGNKAPPTLADPEPVNSGEPLSVICLAGALDLQVQSRDGLALLGMLRRRRYAGRVILMSAVDPRQLRLAGACAEAGNLRVAATLPRPVGRFALRSVLERLASDL